MKPSNASLASLAGILAGVALASGCGSTPSSMTGAAGTSGQAGNGAAGTGAAGTGVAGMGAAGTGAAGNGKAGTGAAAGTNGTAGTGAAAGTNGAAGTGAAAGTNGTAGTGAAGTGAAMGQCTPPTDPNKPIEKLSQTGCVDAKNPTKFSATSYTYEVNSPLWSDTADKERAFVIPAGKKIHVKDCAANAADCPSGTQDEGKWVMPVGTVMVKTFGFDGKLVETRLLYKVDATTWNGYSYQWSEDQKEATVVPADEDLVPINMRRKVTFNTGTHMVDWVYPYRFDCTTCHTQQASGSLGTETRQMNRVVAGMNQIDRWKAAGLFETAPKTPYQAALVLPYDGQLGKVPAGATAEQRARSYLHANCAYCHRPDSDGVQWLDFRYDTAVKDMGACAKDPMKGTLAVTGAQILKPGKPMESTMWLRMNAPFNNDKIRMPQLATYKVDTEGLKVLGDWITSLAACPQ
jgi:uncharacterized repeat protein (TIGR03806 family)